MPRDLKEQNTGLAARPFSQWGALEGLLMGWWLVVDDWWLMAGG